MRLFVVAVLLEQAQGVPYDFIGIAGFAQELC
jgi:hypothetical protein